MTWQREAVASLTVTLRWTVEPLRLELSEMLRLQLRLRLRLRLRSAVAEQSSRIDQGGRAIMAVESSENKKQKATDRSCLMSLDRVMGYSTALL